MPRLAGASIPIKPFTTADGELRSQRVVARIVTEHEQSLPALRAAHATVRASARIEMNREAFEEVVASRAAPMNRHRERTGFGERKDRKHGAKVAGNGHHRELARLDVEAWRSARAL